MTAGDIPHAQRYAPPVLRDPEPSFDDRRRELTERGVRYVLAAYTDVYGVGKAKCVPIDHLSDAMRGSELFTGAALDGLGQTPADDELSVRPELDAVTQLPHRPELAWAPGYLYHGGEPYPMCSRTVLRRALDRAAAMGFGFNLGIEIEFYLVRRRADGAIEPANPGDVLEKAAYDIVDLLGAYPVLDEIVTGGHFNMSLADLETGENLFADPADPRLCGLSELAYHFLGGVLRHAPGLTALACPTVNSYKRLVKSGSMTGFTWAPVFISYGRNNRTHMIRIPSKEPRVESRAVNACCNPYLTAAAYRRRSRRSRVTASSWIASSGASSVSRSPSSRAPSGGPTTVRCHRGSSGTT